MSSSSGAKVTAEPAKLSFNCPKCGKRWTWKPTMAGKKVKCKCEAVFTVPAKPASAAPKPPAPARPAKPSPTPAVLAPMTSSVAPPQEEDALYDIAPGDEKPAPRPPQPNAIQAVVAVPQKKPVGKILGYGRKIGVESEILSGAKRGDIDDIWEGNKLKNLYLPIALIVIACAVDFTVGAFFSGNATTGMNFAAMDLGVRVGVSVPIMLIACFAAVKLLDVSFGPIGPAILKLTSIAIAPFAVLSLLTLAGILLGGAHNAILGGLYGLLLGWAASLILYWWLFHYYFDLQFAEVLKVVLIVWALRIVGGFAATLLLTSLIQALR